MPEQPTLVFVPGSWHKPSCYCKITKLLEKQHKLKCVSITLPSTTGNPAATFKDDIEATRAAITAEIDSGKDVVVIAHSYGGMVGNSAIKNYTRSRDVAANSSPAEAEGQQAGQYQNPRSGHVIGLILIASGFTLTGMAFMDPFFGHPPPSWRVNKETGYADLVARPQDLFYHDLPKDEADYWASQLTTQSLKALFEGGEFAYAGWLDVPSWYIGTVEDQGLPVLAQRMTVGMAREMGGLVEHRELQTSHSPFLSKPEETTSIIVDAVEAFTGKKVEKRLAANYQRKGIAVPGTRLLKPVTWFKFGLPMLFGRVMGRGFLTFRWIRSWWVAT
ncbi:alpha/beta-hydrolase [Microthyrium microscopicum]|uniref:Alpha/beta-hydrolase n=1 Tax=Microthyrium microscopicum TaxID=703497 RepID=A0A6A6UK66_9PEZI|nr:alpha/beta-hydrolase [Microthyrium microscopicum]